MSTPTLNVLIACEFSGIVREAFRRRGHNAWSCDLLPAEDGSRAHFQEDVLHLLAGHHALAWDLLIAHPPCIYLARSGWHWVNAPDSHALPLKGEPRRRAMRDAADFFLALWHAPIDRIAIENPRPIVHACLPPSSQVIQPWMFGHGELKETHLWLKGLPPLTPTRIVRGSRATVHRAPPSPDRWKARSRTYPGLAEAMAEQWGRPDVGEFQLAAIGAEEPPA